MAGLGGVAGEDAAMTDRNRLNDRRSAESFDLEVGGVPYTATVGRFPDGTIGELFLSNHRSNSSADTAARDSAIVLSIALQYGADLETIRRALSRDSQGRATGPLGVAVDTIMASVAPRCETETVR
jgi:hypothetical protein